jgi:hypothetical protein
MPPEDETRDADDRVTAELQRAEYILRSMLFANNEVMRRFGQDLPPIERSHGKGRCPTSTRRSVSSKPYSRC